MLKNRNVHYNKRKLRKEGDATTPPAPDVAPTPAPTSPPTPPVIQGVKTPPPNPDAGD